MLFWIAAALLTVLALALVMWPLTRRKAASEHEAEAVEVALYRSQIAAVDVEARAGRIQPDEIAATEAELKRRMLAAARRRDETIGAQTSDPPDRKTRLAFLAIGIGVPVIAAMIYLIGGHPGLPDRPFAKRAAEREAAGLPSDEEVALTRELADRMAKDPSNPRGWQLLGGAYERQQRYDEAVAAYESAVARKPGDADLLTALGEAMVLQAGGEVTETAREKFDAAVKLSPGHPRATYFVGLAKAQGGDLDGAIQEWSGLLATAPKEAPWRPSIEALIAEAQKQKSAQAGSGSTDFTPEAAASMSPQDRASMIGAMVERLAARLSQSPDDLDGWLRLARSYAVLNEKDLARGALDNAATHFAHDQAALAKIALARSQLGL